MGLRDNPIMYPYVTDLGDPQELADLVAYIQSLPIPTGNGKGPGLRLERGRQLCEQNCTACHGEHGQGSNEAVMAEVVEQYDDRDLSAVLDYVSRLRWVPRDSSKSGAALPPRPGSE
jgi:cytochrome c553